MTDTPHTVNAYGVDPNTIDAAHADRVAHALGLSHAVRIGCGGFLHGISRGVLTITPKPFDLRNPRIVSVPWALVAGLGAQAAGAQVPNGWRLLPEQPTDEMMSAFASINFTGDEVSGLLSFHGDEGNLIACYQAMLAAAPQPADCTPEVQP